MPCNPPLLIQFPVVCNQNQRFETKIKNYPNIPQSFGIGGIIILGFIVIYPLYSILRDIIGREGAMLISHTIVVGGLFLIFFKIKKKKT